MFGRTQRTEKSWANSKQMELSKVNEPTEVVSYRCSEWRSLWEEAGTAIWCMYTEWTHGAMGLTLCGLEVLGSSSSRDMGKWVGTGGAFGTFFNFGGSCSLCIVGRKCRGQVWNKSLYWFFETQCKNHCWSSSVCWLGVLMSPEVRMGRCPLSHR